MTLYETISIVIQSLTLMCAFGAAVIYYRQLKSMQDQLTIGQKQHADSIENTRRLLAFRMIERWNSNDLLKLRTEWNNLFDEIKRLPDKQRISAIKAQEKEGIVGDVLNIFEELSFSITMNTISEDVIKLVLGETLKQYYLCFLPWILERRKDRTDAWSNFSILVNKWDS